MYCNITLNKLIYNCYQYIALKLTHTLTEKMFENNLHKQPFTRLVPNYYVTPKLDIIED
jgi:hypothetical protein